MTTEMTIVGEVSGDNVVYVSGERGLRTQKFSPEAQNILLRESQHTCASCRACEGAKNVTEFGLVQVNDMGGSVPENLLHKEKCRLVNSRHSINRIWLEVASKP